MLASGGVLTGSNAGAAIAVTVFNSGNLPFLATTDLARTFQVVNVLGASGPTGFNNVYCLMEYYA